MRGALAGVLIRGAAAAGGAAAGEEQCVCEAAVGAYKQISLSVSARCVPVPARGRALSISGWRCARFLAMLFLLLGLLVTHRGCN